MKKWLLILIAMIGLSGCGVKEKEVRLPDTKGDTAISTNSSEVKAKLKPEPKLKSSLIPYLVEKKFELNDIAYSILVPSNWKDIEERDEEFSVSMESPSGNEILGISSVDRYDTEEEFQSFVNRFEEEELKSQKAMKEIIDYQGVAYQTLYYSGRSYHIIGVENLAAKFVFLETPTDYVVILLTGSADFFETNVDSLDEMIQSLVAHYTQEGETSV